MRVRRCRATVSGERPARMPLGVSPGRRSDVSIREPGDLVERDVSSHPRRSVDEPLTAGFAVWAVRRRRNHRGSTQVGQRDTGHRAPARQRSGRVGCAGPGHLRIAVSRAGQQAASGGVGGQAGGHGRLHLRRGGGGLRSEQASRRRAARPPTTTSRQASAASLTNAALVAKEALAALDGKLDPTRSAARTC